MENINASMHVLSLAVHLDRSNSTYTDKVAESRASPKQEISGDDLKREGIMTQVNKPWGKRPGQNDHRIRKQMRSKIRANASGGFDG